MAATTVNSNKLLVDFPSFPKAKRSVQFSDRVDGRYIEYPSPEENMKRWYTEADQKRFRKQMGRDAAACSFIVLGGKVTGERQGKMKILTNRNLLCWLGAFDFKRRFSTFCCHQDIAEGTCITRSHAIDQMQERVHSRSTCFHLNSKFFQIPEEGAQCCKVHCVDIRYDMIEKVSSSVRKS